MRLQCINNAECRIGTWMVADYMTQSHVIKTQACTSTLHPPPVLEWHSTASHDSQNSGPVISMSFLSSIRLPPPSIYTVETKALWLGCRVAYIKNTWRGWSKVLFGFDPPRDEWNCCLPSDSPHQIRIIEQWFTDRMHICTAYIHINSGIYTAGSRIVK